MSETPTPVATPVKLPRFWFLVPLGIVIVCVGGISLLRPSRQPQWSLTRVAEAANEEQITQIDVSTSDVMTITLKDGGTVYSVKDSSRPAPEQLSTLGVGTDKLVLIEWTSSNDWDNLFSVLMYLIPLVAVVGTIVWLLSRVVRYDPKG